MFCITLSAWVIIEKEEGPPLCGHSPFKPQIFCHKPTLKEYCLITPAPTPKHHYELLDSIVWLTPTAPTSCAKRHSNKEQASHSNRLKSLNKITSTGYDSLNHKRTSKLRAPRSQGVQFAEFYMDCILQTIRLAWCRALASKTKLLL